MRPHSLSSAWTKVTTPLQPLHHPLFAEYGIAVWIKRDDLNHPSVQGNKWHKLKHNLQAASAAGHTALLTFGGAYSNHIAATAAAGEAFGLDTIGYIRGDELAGKPDRWSHTLRTAQQNGMQLQFLSRADYRRKNDFHFLDQLTDKHPNAYILPEGGTNVLAVNGFAELSETIEHQCPDWTHLYTAVGTGGTLAGLVKFAPRSRTRQLFGIATLNQADSLIGDIERLCGLPHQSGGTVQWRLLTHYAGAGYGRTSAEIQATQHWFESQFQLLLDPIYTAKLVFGFLQELQAQKIPRGAKVVLYHSGGLQGRQTDAQTVI